MQRLRRRNSLMLGLFALGLLAGAAMTAAPAQAASGVGPLLPEPAWDRKLACSTIANCPRFLVLTNWNSEAVLDKETGLVWEKKPDTTPATWSAARSICADKAIGNRKGWRLPSMDELHSVIDVTHPFPGPLLPLGHPFTNVENATYWSATVDAENSLQAWTVGFQGGFVLPSSKGIGFFVWCVRGGMNADTY